MSEGAAGRQHLRIGFVGLGNMGRPMALNLARAGFPLTLYDVDPARATAVAEATGGRAAADLAEVGAAGEVVVTMLPNGAVVREAVLGGADGAPPPGLVAGLRPGSVVLDMSSSSPVGTRELGEALAARGIELVDAPVSGGVPKAADATLATMVGGRPEAIGRCRPVLEALGSKILLTGGLGSGHAMKALNNYVSAAGLAAAAEAVLIGERFGLDPHVAVEVLNASTGRNNSTENKFERYILSGSYDSAFGLRLMAKDVAEAADLAGRLGLDAPLARASRELWVRAAEALDAGADHTEIFRFLRGDDRSDAP